MEKVENELQKPKRYFGLHMVKGVAQYQHPVTGLPDLILVDDPVLKEMDKTMEGIPVYVDHKPVNLDKIREEADGYVVKSFFNPNDGNHWCEFIIVSDKGHEAIRKKWKLSNAYSITSNGPAGKWHAVPYKQQVLGAYYTHLAVVPNPRYSESVILTPDEYAAYNERKKSEVKAVENSIKERKSMFSFFKKEKVENSADLENTFVTLKDGTDKSVAQILKEAQEQKIQNAAPIMDEMVNVGDEKMPVKDLVQKYNAMKRKNADDEEKLKKEKENAEADEKAKKEKAEKENAEKEEADKKAKEKENSLSEQEKQKEVYNSMMNATHRVSVNEPAKVAEIGSDQIARGKRLFGSAK